MVDLLEAGYIIRTRLWDLILDEYKAKTELAEYGLYRIKRLWRQNNYPEMSIVWLEEYLDMIEMTLKHVSDREHTVFIGLSEKLQRFRQNVQRIIQVQVKVNCFPLYTFVSPI